MNCGSPYVFRPWRDEIMIVWSHYHPVIFLYDLLMSVLGHRVTSLHCINKGFGSHLKHRVFRVAHVLSLRYWVCKIRVCSATCPQQYKIASEILSVIFKSESVTEEYALQLSHSGIRLHQKLWVCVCSDELLPPKPICSESVILKVMLLIWRWMFERVLKK